MTTLRDKAMAARAEHMRDEASQREAVARSAREHGVELLLALEACATTAGLQSDEWGVNVQRARELIRKVRAGT